MAKARAYYNVRPYYTCGSPAQVGQKTAERVAREERLGYERTLEGVYGERAAELAKLRGLRAIAERVTEKAKCWLVEDLMTGEVYERPFPHVLVNQLRKKRAPASDYVKAHGLLEPAHDRIEECLCEIAFDYRYAEKYGSGYLRP